MNSKKITYLSIGLLISVFLLFSVLLYRPDKIEVVFLNVGQGDAVLIQTRGIDVLIDGGPGTKVVHELDRHMPFWNRDIELMILTHPHSDHVQGLVEVIKRYDVKKILGYEIEYDAPDYIEWLRLIREKNILFETTKRGDRFMLGEDIFLETLYPFSDISGQHFEDVNDSSIINRLCLFERCVLFTGDAPKEIEEKLLEENTGISSSVLKVGHHGSKYSSSESFIKLVNPEYAIIQSGAENRFNHPHIITIRHLEKQGIRVLRNDLNGEIVCNLKNSQINCLSS